VAPKIKVSVFSFETRLYLRPVKQHKIFAIIENQQSKITSITLLYFGVVEHSAELLMGRSTSDK
jgi:hypothetical protein